jgi:hypothetical protein
VENKAKVHLQLLLAAVIHTEEGQLGLEVNVLLEF